MPACNLIHTHMRIYKHSYIYFLNNLFTSVHIFFVFFCIQEAAKLSTVFEQAAPDLAKFDSPCEVMKSLAEVIKVSDVEFLGLELHRLLRRFGIYLFVSFDFPREEYCIKNHHHQYINLHIIIINVIITIIISRTSSSPLA